MMHPSSRSGPLVLLAGSLFIAACAAQAQTATQVADSPQDQSGAAASANPIHGADPMSGKDRSGPDGWSWAPVSRTQGASASAPGQAQSNQENAARQAKVPATNSQAPGKDPGAPIATRQPGPAGTVPGSADAQTNK